MTNTFAAYIELGVPLIATVLLFIAPKLRPMCYSILGAVLPFLFAYLSAFLAHGKADPSENAFPIDSIWAMTLPAYGLAMLLGVMLGFLKKPTHSAMRISAASLVSILGVSVFIWLT